LGVQRAAVVTTKPAIGKASACEVRSSIPDGFDLPILGAVLVANGREYASMVRRFWTQALARCARADVAALVSVWRGCSLSNVPVDMLMPLVAPLPNECRLRWDGPIDYQMWSQVLQAVDNESLLRAVRERIGPTGTGCVTVRCEPLAVRKRPEPVDLKRDRLRGEMDDVAAGLLRSWPVCDVDERELALRALLADQPFWLYVALAGMAAGFAVGGSVACMVERIVLSARAFGGVRTALQCRSLHQLVGAVDGVKLVGDVDMALTVPVDETPADRVLRRADVVGRLRRVLAPLTNTRELSIEVRDLVGVALQFIFRRADGDPTDQSTVVEKLDACDPVAGTPAAEPLSPLLMLKLERGSDGLLALDKIRAEVLGFA
jgi:hypothetical protein